MKSGEFGKIKSIKSEFAIPSILSGLFFLQDDIRYDYNLGGGATIDLGGEIHVLTFFSMLNLK